MGPKGPDAECRGGSAQRSRSCSALDFPPAQGKEQEVTGVRGPQDTVLTFR